MRPIPPELQTAPAFHREAGASQTLKIQITTAYYGGGVEGGVSDPLTPFRAPSIRGHLRWWWRATKGADAKDFRQLLERESAIWGATDRASRVIVEVLNGRLGTSMPAIKEQNGRREFEQPAYALFPAQSDVVRNIHKRGTFELRISYPADIAADVETALRYWIAFGGIGARTRRGLGALYCESHKGLTNCFQPGDLGDNPKVRPWATLKGARLIVGQPTTWEQAWNLSIEVLKNFRQQRNKGSQPNRPGRSLWPEPDAIRRLRHKSEPRHAQPLTKIDIFPRGTLGLPVIFHFKDRGDPLDNTLQLDGDSDRMASPIILKPVALDGQKAVPVCLALQAPEPKSFVLRQKDAPDLTVSPGDYDLVLALLQAAEKAWKAKIRVL